MKRKDINVIKIKPTYNMLLINITLTVTKKDIDRLQGRAFLSYICPRKAKHFIM